MKEHMKYLRVVDEAGNQRDFETDHVPHIGERIEVRIGRGSQPVKPHWYRVKDVMYRLDNELEHQAAILIIEERNPDHWPE
jgi:hypothetical protein